MNRVAIDPSVVPLEPMSFSALSVPSLDELYQKMCVPDGRVVIRGVDWAFYEHLVDLIPEDCHIHVDYDGKDLELMSPISPFHDEIKTLLGQFVEAVAQELGIPYKGLGQTTWKRFEVARGLEVDDCYYFAPEKLAVADEAIVRWSKDVAEYPNPDLAIEVDVSPSRIDRPAIYAALRIAEVWRFDGEHKRIVIERLSEDRTYQTVDMSEFLPIRSEEVARWMLEEDRRAGSAWGRRMRAWARAELAPRLPR